MKILLKVLPVVIFTFFGANIAMAQFTILPRATYSDGDGSEQLMDLERCTRFMEDFQAEADQSVIFKDQKTRDIILGCAIMTGRVTLSMFPYFVTYMANFLLSLGGIIAVLFIVIGGYNYIYGGVMDQKEKGKKTIIHALMGLMLGILSWVIVQIIITAVTS